MEKLRIQMQEALDPARFDHTLGVAYTAASLSFVYGCDTKQALTAGMLHDCAKCIPDAEKIRQCEECGIEITDVEYENPSLLHAKLGAYLAKERYGVTDEEVCSAIRWHTTGRPDMSLLEKIIFIADFMEPNRKELPQLKEIRAEAFRDPDSCVFHISESILEHLQNNGKTQDPMTMETYRFYNDKY